MTSCLLFGATTDGCRCALAASLVRRVDQANAASEQVLSIDALGFGALAADETARLVLVESDSQQLTLAIRGAVLTCELAPEEVFPLPKRVFATSLFSALLVSVAHGRALLLDPGRLMCAHSSSRSRPEEM